jgi:hypothetical protein
MRRVGLVIGTVALLAAACGVFAQTTFTLARVVWYARVVRHLCDWYLWKQQRVHASPKQLGFGAL